MYLSCLKNGLIHKTRMLCLPWLRLYRIAEQKNEIKYVNNICSFGDTNPMSFFVIFKEFLSLWFLLES